jgi:hypothetical protein
MAIDRALGSITRERMFYVPALQLIISGLKKQTG